MPVPTEVSPQAYRIASWATAALAFLAAVLTFGFGLAALTGPGPTSGGDRLKTGPDPTVAQDGEVLAADQSVITGTITRLVGTKVVAPPLPLPLTLTVVPGKGTKAEISGGSVAGKNAAITWDGGRPLPVRGQGSIDLNGPVNVEITPAGASWSLDGSSRLLTSGSYTFGATVAVSPLNGGLGSPKEGAKLDVPPGATASLLTNSGVHTSTPPGTLTLKGPGQLVLEGALDVRTRSGVRQAKKVTFGPGAFEVDLDPQPDGFHLGRALLQGPTTVDG